MNYGRCSSDRNQVGEAEGAAEGHYPLPIRGRHPGSPNNPLDTAIQRARHLRWWRAIFNRRDITTIPVLLLFAVPFIVPGYVYKRWLAELGTATERSENKDSALSGARSELSKEKSELSSARGESEDLKRAVAALKNSQSPPTPLPLTCLHLAHGIERFGKTFSVTQDSGWRGGGSNPAAWCNVVLTKVRTDNPGAQVGRQAPQDDSRDSCPPFNCRQYKYTCKVVVEADPVYKEAASPACR